MRGSRCSVKSKQDMLIIVIEMHLYEMIKVLLLVSSIPHVVHAFSNPSSKRRYTTKLHEQPVNIRNLLGPISPSTLEKYNLPPDVIQNEW